MKGTNLSDVLEEMLLDMAYTSMSFMNSEEWNKSSTVDKVDKLRELAKETIKEYAR